MSKQTRSNHAAKVGKPAKSEQLVQVTLKFKLSGGKTRVHTLENEEAQRWRDWADAVCLSAWSQGKNPDWSSLNWAIHELV